MTPRSSSARPDFRLACCLCSRPIPRRSDAYVLDDEWARRYPRMRGQIACQRCALGTEWLCRDGRGNYVPGHIRAPGRSEGQDFDAWSHIAGSGTHTWAVLAHLDSAMIQGAADYVRWAATWRGTAAAQARRLAEFLAAWDAHAAEAAARDG